MLQDLGFDRLPILLIVSFSSVFRPKERLPSFNFQKARWDGFASYFDSHCPSAEEYSSLSLSSAAVLFTSLTLNALLTICCSRQTALFLSLLAKTALTYLPTALSVALRQLFSFQQVQYVQVFPMKHAPSCTLFVGLGSTNKSAAFLLLSDSRFVLATLTSSLRFLLPQCLWQIWQELSSLSSCSIRLQWVPGHLFFPENNAADELARRGAPFVPSAIPCCLSPLSIVSTILFSRTGGVLSHQNSSTHRFPRFSPKNLCSYVMLTVFSLVLAATDNAYSKAPISLKLA